jgi:hypothetical protein
VGSYLLRLLGGALADAVGAEHSWTHQVGAALKEGTEVAGWLTVGLGCCRAGVGCRAIRQKHSPTDGDGERTPEFHVHASSVSREIAASIQMRHSGINALVERRATSDAGNSRKYRSAGGPMYVESVYTGALP